MIFWKIDKYKNSNLFIYIKDKLIILHFLSITTFNSSSVTKPESKILHFVG